MAALLHTQGVLVRELGNETATRAGVREAVRHAAEGFQPDDLLVLYVSGHGGQRPDRNGDEEDGQDETLCLWDGELIDDELATLWQSLPKGVRVLFITDTCNSGTNYRGPRNVGSSLVPEYPGSLLHFGGSADGKSSFGSQGGGAWTNALLSAWRSGQTYQQWFARAEAGMSASQAPVMASVGTGPAFADRLAAT